MNEHPEARPLHLAYFNHVDPRLVGLEFRLPPFDPHPGWYAISIHFVQGGSFSAPDESGRWRLVPLRGYDYFRSFRPVARGGYSILIYRISAAEAEALRRTLGLPPLENRMP